MCDALRLTFRTDASVKIGTGHVMRCLTLARALTKQGAKCQFVCRVHQGNLIDFLNQQGFETHGLSRSESDDSQSNQAVKQVTQHDDWLGATWQQDARQTIEMVADRPIDWLIVDHYALEQGWESQLRPYTNKIMVIDDLADRQHNCDLLLDQNLSANASSRYQGLLPEKSAVLLGPAFALLQHDYAQLHLRTPPRHSPVKHILVYFGGSDTHNLTGLAITSFLTLNRPDIQLDVVINPHGQDQSVVRAMADQHDNITIYESLPTLARLMIKADLAIGAGGATTWERACLGLPTLVITLAENQKPATESCHQQGIVTWVGHYDQLSDQILTRAMLDAIVSTTLQTQSQTARALVDGQGTDRVVTTLLLDANTPLRARLAQLDDESLLLRWANDPLVRKQAFHPETISTETHRQWFYSRLRDYEHCKLYIVETKEGLPVGQVRFDLSDNGWEIGYSIDAAARGRKLGQKVLETAMLALREVVQGTLVFGIVKAGNKASQTIFHSLGFEEECGGGGVSIIYRYLLR